jgi:tRNA(Ile2) C34 agmatinyltransferase TiaS
MSDNHTDGMRWTIGHPPLCQPKCRVPMERLYEGGKLIGFRCPLCERITYSEPIRAINAVPKCPLCGRRAKLVGDQYVCPDCKGIVDHMSDGVTDASTDPTRRIEQQERKKQRAPAAHHRGGTHERWKPKQRTSP